MVKGAILLIMKYVILLSTSYCWAAPPALISESKPCYGIPLFELNPNGHNFRACTNPDRGPPKAEAGCHNRVHLFFL